MMTFLVNNWLLLALALVSGGLLLWPVLMGGPVAGSVSPSDAVMLINRSKAVLIDVSDAAEYALGHAGGAKHLAFADVQAKLGTVVKDKKTTVLMLCTTGARAGKAVKLAQELGYLSVQSIAGGTAGWRSASLPIEKTA